MCSCGSPLRDVRCRNPAAIRPVRLDHLDAAVAATRERRLPLQIVQRRVHRAFVRVAHRQIHARVAERPQHAHRLRRRERQIEPGDLAVRRRRQLVRIGRIMRLQHRPQLRRIDLAVEAELIRRRQPSARSLRRRRCSSPRSLARPDRGSTAAAPTRASRCSTRRPRTDRYMAAAPVVHLCEANSIAVVRTRESHAPLGAPRRGQMRQETSRSYATLRARVVRINVDASTSRTPASNPPDPPGPASPPHRPRAANVKVERPERSEDERLYIRRAAGHPVLRLHAQSAVGRRRISRSTLQPSSTRPVHGS